jgi:lipopolysaccharide export system permease protein
MVRLSVVDRYILKRVTWPLGAGILIGTAAQLLERLIGLLDLFANHGGPLTLILKMLATLVPQYLTITIPAAFFIAILYATLRMSNDSELDVMRGSGISLHRLAAPMMVMAVILTVASAIILGFLQPYTHYAYRALVYLVTETSWNSAIERGTFFSGFGGKTILVGDIADGGRALSKIFIQETDSGGNNVVLTAQTGELTSDPQTFSLTLILHDGVRIDSSPDGTRGHTTTFDQSKLPLEVVAPEPFQPRGNRHSEMSFSQLIRAYLHPLPGVKRDEVSSELNCRIAQALTILFLPLIAIPLGLRSRRQPTSIRIVGGIAILIIYYEVLQFGQHMVEGGRVSAFVAIWTPFLSLAFGAVHLFYIANSMLNQDPLAVVFVPIESAWDWVKVCSLALLKRRSAAAVPGEGAHIGQQ